MIKHTLLAGTALAVALTLAACGDNSSTPPAPTGSGSGPTTKSVSDAAKVQADKLLADAGQYVKDHKWELADTGIKQLEQMKPNLPPEYGPKIDDLRKLYNAAKAAGVPAMSMPAMPKM